MDRAQARDGAIIRAAKAPRAAIALLALSLMPACSAVSGYQIAAQPPSPLPTHVDFNSPPLTSRWLNGVALPSMTDLSSWQAKTGEHPAIIAMFARFGAPLPTVGITQALMAGAVPLVQLDPSGTSLSAISSGKFDRQLRGYAAELRALDDPVLLSFGHEMNGVWYSWGCQQARPAAFRAAWRHIHDSISAPNVSWVWTINDIWQGDPCPLRPWYPGIGLRRLGWHRRLPPRVNRHFPRRLRPYARRAAPRCARQACDTRRDRSFLGTGLGSAAQQPLSRRSSRRVAWNRLLRQRDVEW